MQKDNQKAKLKNQRTATTKVSKSKFMAKARASRVKKKQAVKTNNFEITKFY